MYKPNTTNMTLKFSQNSLLQSCQHKTLNLTKKLQLPLNQCLSDSNLGVFLQGTCAYLQQRNICLYIHPSNALPYVSGSFPSEWWYCLLGGLTCTFREINHCIVTYSLRRVLTWAFIIMQHLLRAQTMGYCRMWRWKVDHPVYWRSVRGIGVEQKDDELINACVMKFAFEIWNCFRLGCGVIKYSFWKCRSRCLAGKFERGWLH